MYEGGYVIDFEFFGRLGKLCEIEKSDFSIILEWDELLYGMCFV